MFLDLKLREYTLLTLLLAMPTISMAVENALTLKESISFALQHNRMLSASANQADAAQAQVDMATGRLLPRLDVSTGFYRTNSPLNSFGTKLQQQNVSAADFDPNALNNPAFINNYQSRLGLSMPLFSGGANWAARSSAKSLANASVYALKQHQQQLIYQTISAYVMARQSLAQVHAQEQALHAATKRWQDAQALKKRGIVIESDVMDANVHVLRNQVALDQAQGMYADSLESLRLIMGMNEVQDIETLAEPTLNYNTPDLEALIAHAASQRADLLALQQQVEAASSEQTQAQAGYLPHINLVAAQEWNHDSFGLQNDNTMVGINVTMNIFAGGADAAQSRAAASKHIILGLQLQDKKQQIRNEINQAWRGVSIAQKRLHGETEAMKQTAESLRIKSLRHKQGLETTSDLLDAQARADASTVAQIRATYDFIIAKTALLLAAGTLTEEVVQ